MDNHSPFVPNIKNPENQLLSGPLRNPVPPIPPVPLLGAEPPIQPPPLQRRTWPLWVAVLVMVAAVGFGIWKYQSYHGGLFNQTSTSENSGQLGKFTERNPEQVFEMTPTDKVTGIALLPYNEKAGFSYYVILNENSVVLSGKRGPVFDRIGSYGPTFSRQFQYVGTKNDTRGVYVDNVLMSGNYEVDSELPASLAENGRLAFVAREGDKKFVVVDGKPGPLYDRIDRLQFSQDGTYVSYQATLGDNELVVHNGVPGRLYQSVNFLGTSGSHYSYHAYRDCAAGNTDNCPARLVVDGKEVPLKELNLDQGGVLSEGGYYAVLERNGKKVFVYNGEEIGEYERIMGPPGFTYPVFSMDDKRYAFTATSNGKSFAVVDGKKEKEYDYVSPIALDYDGSLVQYWGKNGCGDAEYAGLIGLAQNTEGCKVFVVTNGKEELVDTDAVSYIKGPEGKVVTITSNNCSIGEASGFPECVYTIKENGKVVGRPYKNIVSIDYIGNDLAVLSSDENFGYNGRFLFQGKESEQYTFINYFDTKYGTANDPQVTVDGKHYTYSYHMGEENGEEFMVVDSKNFGPFSEVLCFSYSFDGKELYYLYRAGQTIFSQTIQFVE